MTKYKIGRQPEKLKAHNAVTWVKIAGYIDRNGPQTEETIKMLCGRHKPGWGTTPSGFFRYCVKNGWLVEA